jgi:hypothetical protein
MKIAVIVTGALSLAMTSIPAIAGTINSVEVTGSKYTSSKCKAPEAPGLVIRTMKSGAAFTKAAEAHNVFSAAISDYQKCRVEELNADQAVLVAQAKADIEALIAISNAEAAELTAKQKELKR